MTPVRPRPLLLALYHSFDNVDQWWARKYAAVHVRTEWVRCAAGPQMDIVRPAVRPADLGACEPCDGAIGFLASDAHGMAQCIVEAVSMDETRVERMAAAARTHVEQFSEQSFTQGWLRCMAPLHV